MPHVERQHLVRGRGADLPAGVSHVPARAASGTRRKENPQDSSLRRRLARWLNLHRRVRIVDRQHVGRRRRPAAGQRKRRRKVRRQDLMRRRQHLRLEHLGSLPAVRRGHLRVQGRRAKVRLHRVPERKILVRGRGGMYLDLPCGHLCLQDRMRRPSNCSGGKGSASWTNTAGNNENLPITCVNAAQRRTPRRAV